MDQLSIVVWFRYKWILLSEHLSTTFLSKTLIFTYLSDLQNVVLTPILLWVAKQVIINFWEVTVDDQVLGIVLAAFVVRFGPQYSFVILKQLQIIPRVHHIVNIVASQIAELLFVSIQERFAFPVVNTWHLIYRPARPSLRLAVKVQAVNVLVYRDIRKTVVSLILLLHGSVLSDCRFSSRVQTRNCHLRCQTVMNIPSFDTSDFVAVS